MREASEQALASILTTVVAPELLILMKWIKSALLEPHSKTEDCINELLEVTFVNGLDTSSLALLVPIVVRALRHRSTDLLKKAAKCCKNICSLVVDYEAECGSFSQISQEHADGEMPTAWADPRVSEDASRRGLSDATLGSVPALGDRCRHAVKKKRILARAMVPFQPLLLPELEKLIEHSYPEVYARIAVPFNIACRCADTNLCKCIS